jgi:D-alanine-D-alanine ligase
MPRVLILFNAPVLPPDHPDAEQERDVLHTAKAVGEVLRASHEVRELGLALDVEPLFKEFRDHRPDVVFNLYEGAGGRPDTEYYVAGLLEWLQIPYTGCPVTAMVLGRDKVRTKHLLRGTGLPTADFQVVARLEDLVPPQGWPVIVKPAGTDASLGIEQASVVMTVEALRERAGLLLTRYGPPVLVESYLPGPEFNVGVVHCPDRIALPVAELVYTPQPGVAWPIVTYASKWEPGSAEDLAMQPRCPAQIDAAVTRELQEVALAAYELLGCRDYARIDLRLDAAGRPMILEVNPNPDLGPTAGLARMLNVAGWGFERFVEQLVRQRV